jgi:tellurium resistance protein TerD
MGFDLEKKKPFDLTKREPGLRNIVAGLGWDSNVVNGENVDCDVSVFMLGENGKLPGDGFFVYFNQLKSEDGSVIHLGDNRTGAGEGDDESIEIELTAVSQKVIQLLFTVTIHKAEERAHHFGLVSNAFIRIYNKNNNNELCKFMLTDQFDGMDSVIIGRLFRDGNEWRFEAMGDAYAGGLQTLIGLYY